MLDDSTRAGLGDESADQKVMHMDTHYGTHIDAAHPAETAVAVELYFPDDATAHLIRDLVT